MNRQTLALRRSRVSQSYDVCDAVCDAAAAADRATGHLISMTSFDLDLDLDLRYSCCSPCWHRIVIVKVVADVDVGVCGDGGLGDV